MESLKKHTMKSIRTKRFEIAKQKFMQKEMDSITFIRTKPFYTWLIIKNEEKNMNYQKWKHNKVLIWL